MIYDNYTIFSNVRIFCKDGTYYADPLWEKDIYEHSLYINNLSICCPVKHVNIIDNNLHKIRNIEFIQIIRISFDVGWLYVLINLFPNFLKVFYALRKSKIVHSGAAGWPIPVSYYILFCRMFLRFQWIVVVESSFWLVVDGKRSSLRKRIFSPVHLFLVRRCLKACDARIFTQDWYRRLFFGGTENCLIAPAIWVDASQVIRDQESAQRQTGMSKRLRVLFPARLVAEKGVDTILEAIRLLRDRVKDLDRGLDFDIIGAGPMLDVCRSAAGEGNVRVRVLDPVPYGKPFFHLLREYHTIVIANRNMEQPRIIFDAFSQGVCCISTRTEGVIDIIEEGSTGALFDIDDPVALADILISAMGDTSSLIDMGTNARRYVSAYSHRKMHQTRETFLATTLQLSQTNSQHI